MKSDVDHGNAAVVSARGADPVTAEVIRQALISASEEMKTSLCRAACSPLLYEVLDFACGLYDRRTQLLAQAKSLPLFLGTLNYSIDAAVAAVGGEEQLEDGDIILLTYAYDIGSHPQDAVVVQPVFAGGELVGYSTVKAHLPDIGAKDPYCTDTLDTFQEGTIFPGVKIYRGGVRNEDIFRIFVANSRYPQDLIGDFNAQISAVRVGAEALRRIIDKYGLAVFDPVVEMIFSHGESVVRRLFEAIPDGRYVGVSALDNNGITDELIPIEIAVEVRGSDVVIDYTNAPPEQEGPVNCPLPGTVSASRVAITALAGVRDSPNEGHFRPLSVRTKPGTIFDPNPPAPVYLYHLPGWQAIEVIHRALSEALPSKVPAGAAGDVCGLYVWGKNETGAAWLYGGPHVIGQGASAQRDGVSALQHIGLAGTRSTPVEVTEARNPWVVERHELATDSGGPGRTRGGLGVDIHVRLRCPTFLTPLVDRTKTPSWGLFGGSSGRPNNFTICYPDGTEERRPKVTRFPVPAGTLFKLQTGGGGGYGPAKDRVPEAVHDDVREGYVTDERARADYPHAFEG